MTHEEFEELVALDALGTATDEERAGIDAHLASCADCQVVAAEYLSTAAALGISVDPVAPPAAIRDRLLARIQAENAPAPHEIEMIRRAKAQLRKPAWWLSAAAVFFLALFGWSELRYRAARESVHAVQTELAASVEENRRLNRNTAELSSQVASIAAASTRTMALAGKEIAPDASARVFLDTKQRRAIVFFSNLPANPGDKSYQLWIIRADQPAPQGAGVFDADPTGSAQIVVENLPIDTEIKALAVTLEPRGGVSAPTGEMYLLGSP